MEVDRFCQCPCCGTWFSSQDILASPAVEPLGMMRDVEDRERNLLFFNHLVPGCGSTFTIDARRFTPFLPESPPTASLADGTECQHHCTSIHDLTECGANCRWAPYRRLLLELRHQRGLT